MKKLALLTALMALSFVSLGQIVVNSRFKPFSIGELMAPVQEYSRAHDKANAQINELINFVVNALGQNIDETLRSQLNSDYNSLTYISKYLNTNGLYKDIWADIDYMRTDITKHIVEYNNRIAIAQQEYEEEMRRVAEEEMKKASEPEEWSGTGFALNNGYLVTNYHVVEDARSIVVKGIKGDFSNAYNAEVVATDKFNDLALLRITDNRFSEFGTIPYKVKTNTSEVGEEIFVLGYPLTSTMGDEIKLTTGVISSKTGFQGDVSLYQISAPVQPGNSGGPLFDSKGNLIGIVNSKHTGAESVGYAVKTSYLMNLVESAVSSSIIPVNNTITSQPLTGKVKSVKNYVFMISCSNSIGQDKQIINEGKPVSNVAEITETKNDVNLIRYFSNVIIDTKMFTWKLISIEVNDSNTILTQTCIPKINDAYIYCDKSEYIEDAETGDKYYLVSSSIAMSPEMTFIGDSERTFSESYPKLPSTVKVINIWAGNSYYVKNYRIR